jgi:hypothetical protein
MQELGPWDRYRSWSKKCRGCACHAGVRLRCVRVERMCVRVSCTHAQVLHVDARTHNCCTCVGASTHTLARARTLHTAHSGIARQSKGDALDPSLWTIPNKALSLSFSLSLSLSPLKETTVWPWAWLHLTLWKRGTAPPPRGPGGNHGKH